MNKKNKNIIICILIISILFLIIYFGNKIYQEQQKENLIYSAIWENLDIINNGNYGGSVYNINYSGSGDIYDLLYQNIVTKKLITY